MGIIYSICIPTYNRPHEVERFLRMFSEILGLDNLNERVELCIADNNENTTTKETVDSYIKKGFLRIRYHRWGKNVGYDRNALKAFELATGEYMHAASDEIDYTQQDIAKIVRVLENEKKDGVYLNKKGNPSRDPIERFRYMFSPSGIVKYFGTFMSLFIVKRVYCVDFITEHKKDMENYFGKAFMHLPLFVYFLQRAKELSFSRITMDTGKQAVLFPAKKSELYIRDYYFLIKACKDTGLIDDKTFQRFRRNYLFVWPVLLFKIRIYMPLWVYDKEIGAVLEDMQLVENEFDGIAKLTFPVWRVLLFNKLTPYHWIYELWYLYKTRVRKDQMSVNLFEEYKKRMPS